MNAYVVVEFTVKDPETYREKYAPLQGRQQRTMEVSQSPAVGGKSSTAMARSVQECSYVLPTVRRPSGGTTRPNISS